MFIPARHQDYDLYNDVSEEKMTYVTYAYKEGEGIKKHSKSDRGAVSVNFSSGVMSTVSGLPESKNSSCELHFPQILMLTLPCVPSISTTIMVLFLPYFDSKQSICCRIVCTSLLLYDQPRIKTAIPPYCEGDRCR